MTVGDRTHTTAEHPAAAAGTLSLRCHTCSVILAGTSTAHQQLLDTWRILQDHVDPELDPARTALSDAVRILITERDNALAAYTEQQHRVTVVAEQMLKIIRGEMIQ